MRTWNESAFRNHLQALGAASEVVDDNVAMAGEVARFLAGIDIERGANRKEDVERFARQLIQDGRNTQENIRHLIQYADWLGDRGLYVALIELLDCYSALEVLAEE